MHSQTSTIVKPLASAEEQAAMADLMEPAQRLVADAPLYEPPAQMTLVLI